MQLRRFFNHTGGVSAVEFALSVPVLVIVLSGIVTGWFYAMQVMQMRTAVKTGANYVLQGGVDLDAANDGDPAAFYRTMYDLIALAFDADITRSVTFMLSREDGMGISDTFPIRIGPTVPATRPGRRRNPSTGAGNAARSSGMRRCGRIPGPDRIAPPRWPDRPR